jgi:hypothetical protein
MRASRPPSTPFFPLLAALLFVAAGPAASQQYSGTFTVPNEVGGVMTMVLAQSGASVTGSLSSNGVEYAVDGQIQDGTLVGMLSGAQGTLHFSAERWENELWLELYGTDASGQPNYDDYTEIDLVLEGSESASTSASGQAAGGGVNPLGGGAGNPLAGGGGDPYVGTFGDGSVTLSLAGGNGRYQGSVTVSGATYPVQAEGGAQGIQGTIQAPDGQYPLVAQAQGDMVVLVSGGVQYNLRRQAVSAGAGRAGAAGAAPGRVAGAGGAGATAGRTSGGRELAPGFTEDHPQVREWVQFLSGKKLTRMNSYSSGNSGGFNARTDVYLCSDRTWAMRDESSVSVDVGGAFGNSGGVGSDRGQWYVITNGQVVGLILESVTGEVSEFRMDYQNQETYANGERVYVTPAEVCM